LLQTLWTLLPFLMIGSLAGLLSGLLGIGGGLVLVPLLTLNGVPLHQAVGMSLLYILITGTSGAYFHFRQAHLRWSVALLLAIGGCFASYLGTLISHQLPTSWLAWLFMGLIMGVMLLFILRRQEVAVLTTVLTLKDKGIALLIGILAGLLSGIFGVGGGFVMTPLLNIFLPLSVEVSIGTSLAAVVLISSVGAFSHFLVGDLFVAFQRWPVAMLIMGLAGAFSAPLGARLTRIWPARRLQNALMILMGAVGVYMLIFGIRSH
jgi:uncharacterized protein